MAKDPAFPFYAQDYLVDTIRWSRGMQGLHVSLIAESWANGGLMDEGGQPAGLGSTDVELWFKIKHKWKLVEGMWISEKLEEVRAARNIFKEKQREKGILSGKKRTKVQPKHEPKMNRGSTVVEPLESEKEKENVFNKKEPVSKLEIFEAIFTDDIFIGNLQMTHRQKDLRQAFEECYIHHSSGTSPPADLGEWKQKLNSWLSNTKINGTSKKSGKETPEDLAKAFAERRMRDANGG